MVPEDRIKEYVYAGKVMDERGNWITLAEKLKKEKAFQKHIEQGEILYGGKWTHVSKIKLQQQHFHDAKIDVDPDAVVEEETTVVSIHKIDKKKPAVSEKAAEETVSFSTDTIQGFPVTPSSDIDEETDFPAETTAFKIDRTGDTVTIEFAGSTEKTPVNAFINGETQMDFSIDGIGGDDPIAEDETEFKETVLYNINVLKEDKSRKVPQRTSLTTPPKSAFHESIELSHKAELDKLRKKNRLTALFIIILVLALVALLVKNLI